MSAPVTLLEVAAEGRSPAVLNVSQRFPLMARYRPAPTFQEIALMGAEDIGQFGPRIVHR
jgi:hypothetical protein